MPLPDFVEEGDGSCRASVINSLYFGTVSNLSVVHLKRVAFFFAPPSNTARQAGLR